MCGRAYSPNFLFLWPTARISVMGGPQVILDMDECFFNKKGKKCVTNIFYGFVIGCRCLSAD